MSSNNNNDDDGAMAEASEGSTRKRQRKENDLQNCVEREDEMPDVKRKATNEEVVVNDAETQHQEKYESLEAALAPESAAATVNENETNDAKKDEAVVVEKDSDMQQQGKNEASTSAAAAATVEEEDIADAKKDRGWIYFYNKLVAYKQEHGSCEVPQRYKDDPALGSWCKNQREYYKNYTKNKASSLTEERIGLLNKIGFAWVATKTKRRVMKDFDIHIRELKQFREVHGNTRVPHVYDANPGLGVFVHRVKIYRREMQEGKRKSTNEWLTPTRIQALDEIQFEWKVGRWKNALSWDERYAQLVEHKNRHGHCNVSKDYDEQHAPGLKAWVANQRSYLTRVPSKEKKVKSAATMSEEKVASLKKIGVDFERAPVESHEDVVAEAEDFGLIGAEGTVSL